MQRLTVATFSRMSAFVLYGPDAMYSSLVIGWSLVRACLTQGKIEPRVARGNVKMRRGIIGKDNDANRDINSEGFAWIMLLNGCSLREFLTLINCTVLRFYQRVFFTDHTEMYFQHGVHVRCLWLSWSEWKFALVKRLSTQKLLVYTCGSWALLALLLAGKISTTTMNLGKRLSPASLRRYLSSVGVALGLAVLVTLVVGTGTRADEGQVRQIHLRVFTNNMHKTKNLKFT